MRHLLAVALVATALATDEAVAAVGHRVDRGAENRGLVSKLTVQFRRAVAASMIPLSRQDRVRPSAGVELIQIEETLGFGRGLLQPFQLHLPPPARQSEI